MAHRRLSLNPQILSKLISACEALAKPLSCQTRKSASASSIAVPSSAANDDGCHRSTSERAPIAQQESAKGGGIKKSTNINGEEDLMAILASIKPEEMLASVPLLTRERRRDEAAVGGSRGSRGGCGAAAGSVDEGGGRTEEDVIRRRPPPPPPEIRYYPIIEDHAFTIAMFQLTPGAEIPFHDHPGMTVYSRVLRGAVEVTSLDWMDSVDGGEGSDLAISPSSSSPPSSSASSRSIEELGRTAAFVELSQPAPPPPPPRAGLARKTGVMTLQAPATTIVRPQTGNIHRFRTIGDTDCVIFDILLPPYSYGTERECTYYLMVDIIVKGRYLSLYQEKEGEKGLGGKEGRGRRRREDHNTTILAVDRYGGFGEETRRELAQLSWEEEKAVNRVVATTTVSEDTYEEGGEEERMCVLVEDRHAESTFYTS